MQGIYWDVGGWPLESVVEETRKLTEKLALPMDKPPERQAERVAQLSSGSSSAPHTKT